MKFNGALVYTFAILIFFLLIITLFVEEESILDIDSEMEKMTGTGAITIEAEPEEEINEAKEFVIIE